MGDQELIEKWLSNTPPDDSADKVERILVRFFGASSVTKQSGGSHHYRVKHPALRNVPDCGPYGHLSIPVKNGTRVKGHYLKRIAQAIKQLEEVNLD